ncbi:MAG: phosphomevalonate kinase [Erysipelothrix sp.]|nr:phosphomevalonate kinase [Erysipelothrix sp.]
MITAKAPGKLYIAGEYAVVTPGYPAVLVAVNRFITVSIEPTVNEGTIVSKQYSHIPLKWQRINGMLVVEKRDNPFHYILEAIKIVEEYAKELNRPLQVFNVFVESELDSEQGAKYGLGSSAAVTIATIRALMQLYEIDQEDYTVYKLAVLAHLKLGSNGSFGDLAASVMTGWCLYQSFDRLWVYNQSKKVSLSQLIQLKWPSLLIKKLTPLSDYNLVVGWTQKPASTFDLVNKVKKKTDEKVFWKFLRDSKDCVDTLVVGFQMNDGHLVSEMIQKNRQLLKDLDPMIETPALSTLIEIASDFGVAKTSGAGGGDCGIALVHKQMDDSELIDLWNNHGIEKLEIEVYDKTYQERKTKQ